MTVAIKKILLVDDSAAALMWERMILKDEPYSLLSATDGIEAVETATRELPDLILMDVLMPRMSGFEACAALRASPATRTVPIIMVSTRSEARDVQAGFASGCTDYITKPLDRVELLVKVRNCLTRAA